jgi:hypothetical protein
VPKAERVGSGGRRRAVLVVQRAQPGRAIGVALLLSRLELSVGPGQECGCESLAVRADPRAGGHGHEHGHVRRPFQLAKEVQVDAE